VRRSVAGACLLALLAAALGAQTDAPTAVATAAKREVTVGERFLVEVRASGPAGTVFVFPEEAITDTFELRPAPGEGAAPLPEVHRYEAAVFTLDEAEIAPIPVRYRLADGTTGEVATEPIRLEIVSLLPKDPQERKLADVRGPVEAAIGAAFYLAAALAALLTAALAFWLWRRRGRKRTAAPAPVSELPPDLEALRALERAAALLARGDLRLFYIALVAAAKTYLERRLHAPVLEMTSAETTAFLRGHPHGVVLLPVLRDLTEAADRIKFARGEGLRDEAERQLGAVRALVPALETRLRPAPAEAA
jgi:hypothetical protein